MGGGIQDTYHRRPVIQPDDVAAMVPVMLGSGVNLYGTYMFQGGENPDGKLTTLQESQGTNYPTDVPVKSYDFQAPLGEFGQEREVFRKLKGLQLLHARFRRAACAHGAPCTQRSSCRPRGFESRPTDGSRAWRQRFLVCEQLHSRNPDANAPRVSGQDQVAFGDSPGSRAPHRYSFWKIRDLAFQYADWFCPPSLCYGPTVYANRKW